MISYSYHKIAYLGDKERGMLFTYHIDDAAGIGGKGCRRAVIGDKLLNFHFLMFKFVLSDMHICM